MTTHQTIALRDILVAIDFSSQSSRAFDAAAALARHFDATLHVLHVVGDTSQEESAGAKLESLTAEFAVGVEALTTVVSGNAAQEIVQYATRKNVDLIVLGTHGRSGLARVFMGSVAEEVLRSAPCQVLTIGPKAHGAQEAPPLATSLRSDHVRKYPKPGFCTELAPYCPQSKEAEDPQAEMGAPEPRVIWYEDTKMMAIHRQLVRAGMERARQLGKRIGRPRVTERPEFLDKYQDVMQQINAGGLSRRQAAKQLRIGYATLKRLIDGASKAPGLPACPELAIESRCAAVLD